MRTNTIDNVNGLLSASESGSGSKRIVTCRGEAQSTCTGAQRGQEQVDILHHSKQSCFFLFVVKGILFVDLLDHLANMQTGGRIYKNKPK